LYEDVNCILELYNDEKRSENNKRKDMKRKINKKRKRKKEEKKIMRKELGLKRRERAVEGGNIK